jgi:hypothetical protein
MSLKLNSLAVVHEQTIPTELPPLALGLRPRSLFVTERLVFSITFFTALLGGGFQRRTNPSILVPKLFVALANQLSKSKLLYDWRSVSQYVLVSGTPLGPMTRFLFPFFCRKIALLFVLGRPLWREDGSVICSAICQWSESRRTHNHTLLSHLRLLGSFSVASCDSQGNQLSRWSSLYRASARTV